MRVSYGKWTKYKLMLKDERLLHFLPETQYFQEEFLWEMLDKHSRVMLKPSYGYQGIGVIQLSALENEQFELHIGHKKIILQGKEETYTYLRKNHLTRKKPRYIIQQKISLAAIDGHPFDLRVMVQRKKNSSEWTVTGKLAKVAANNYVITNAAKALLSVEAAIEQSALNNVETDRLITEIDQVSLLVVQQLAKSYSKKRTYGIDIGIDQQGKVWIIEANLSPSVSIFKRADDDMYQRIQSYKRG